MAYTVRNDATGAIVYDPRIEEAVLIDPVLHLKDNSFGSLNCDMPTTHVEYGRLQKRRTVYAVYKNDAPNPIWKGILIKGHETLDALIELYFEDFMSVLRDSMQDAFSHRGQPSQFLELLLAHHNNQVQPWQQIHLGVVSVTDADDNVLRSSEDEMTTWDAIANYLLKTLGGHLRMRYVGGVAYLDYLHGDTTHLDPNLNTSTQVIEFGENLKDFSRLISSAETYSACIPKGYSSKQYDADGVQYSARLTISAVNNGSKYLIDDDAIALYGFRCAPINVTTWDDVTDPGELMARGWEYLRGNAVKLANTIKLSAVDLWHLGVASDSIGFLDYVRASVLPYEIDAVYLLTEISIPLDDPSELTISLGETFLSLADRQQQTAANLQQQIETVVRNTNTETQTGLQNEIADAMISMQTLIEQTGQSIMSQVSEIYISSTSFEEFQQQVSTMFSQTENMFELQFSTIVSQITTLDGSVMSRFFEINKYIRFVDGKIMLGEDGNPLILEITNERISFLYNNVEIAYFSAGRLYVDRLEAMTSLTLGNFAFGPDSSNGMSLKYIGT